jgi:hypothetical protein
MPAYYPFNNKVDAMIRLGQMADNKVGPDCGIVWQEGTQVTVLRPPVPHKDGSSSTMVIQSRGPVPKADPPPADKPERASARAQVIQAVGVAADTVGVVIAGAAFFAVFALVGPEVAAGFAVAAIAMVVWDAVPLAINAACLVADGGMLFAELADDVTGGDLQGAVDKFWLYHDISTYGPALGLLTMSGDVKALLHEPAEAKELAQFTKQIEQKLGVLQKKWETDFNEKDWDHMQFLKSFRKDVEEKTSDVVKDLRKLRVFGAPADLLGMGVDWHDRHEILDGMASDFRNWMTSADQYAATAPRYYRGTRIFPPATNQNDVPMRRDIVHLQINVLTAKPVRLKR